MLYHGFGRVMESDLPLPELIPCEAGAPDFRVRLDPSAARAAGLEPAAAWETLLVDSKGRPWAEAAAAGRDVRVRFREMADFLVGADGREVAVSPLPDLPPATLRHLLLDQLMPFVLSQGGDAVLHGSGVEVRGAAVVLLGESGAGKSTMAAALCANGHPLLSDDVAILRPDGDGARVIPSYPGLRLWPEDGPPAGLRGPEEGPAVAHYTTKVRVPAAGLRGGAAVRPVPLGRIVLLFPATAEAWTGAPPRPEPVPPREALMEVLVHAFLLRGSNREHVQRQFEILALPGILSRVRVLRFPRDRTRLSALADAVADEAAVS